MNADSRHRFSEDDYIPLSALQHYCFCPRQCALIHLDREWAENPLTGFGRIEHERVDTAPGTTRGAVHTARGVDLVCHRLGIRGKADAIDYTRGTDGTLIICPIEYKHGKPKEHRADEIQLCAQALCLEEMHACRIPAGALFYHATRRRLEIPFDDTLRELTQRTITETRALFRSRALPPAHRGKSCNACSLVSICLPTTISASAYNEQQFSLSDHP